MMASRIEILTDIGEIEGTALIGDRGRTGRIDCHLAQQLAGKLDHAAVIAVGLIELEHRKFGILMRRDAFVAKIAIDFVDALDAADDAAV